MSVDAQSSESDLQEPVDELSGRLVLSRYRVVRPLARGGMGLIYLARSEGSAGFIKPVVVKRILSDLVQENNMVKMFKREARIMAMLRHPNIVSVLDFGQEGVSYYMVLDYIHGFHLGRWYRYFRSRGIGFPVEIAIYIACQILDALHYAHNLVGDDKKPLNLIHRDVTPSNVLIDVQGQVKLADFGIARMRGDQTEFKTTESTIKGKFPYIPPEVFRGGEPNQLSDLYATAVVLHEILVAKNEFRMGEVSSTIAKVLQHEPSRLNGVRTDISPELDDVLQKALAKDPSQRFQSALAFKEALVSVRRWPLERVQEALSKQADEDFNSVEMATYFDATPLHELDRAWRDYKVGPISRSDSKDLTVAAEPDPPALRTTSSEAVRKTPRRSKLPGEYFLWAAIPLAAIGAVALYFGLRSPLAEPPVVVYAAPTENEESPPQPTLSEKPSESGSGAISPAINPMTQVAPTAGTKQSEKRPISKNARLSAAFAKNSAKISHCFEQFVGEKKDAVDLTIEFSVDVEGHVESVSLNPKTLEQSPLGACILGVARKTVFSAQDHPVQFKIPIKTTRAAR